MLSNEEAKSFLEYVINSSEYKYIKLPFEKSWLMFELNKRHEEKKGKRK